MSTKNHSIFKSNNCLIIITGASKGFGRCLVKKFFNTFSEQFSNDNDAKIKFLLISRNIKELDALDNEIMNLSKINCNIVKIIADLENIESMNKIENEFKNNITSSSSSFDHFILIHNAGSIGNTNELCNTVNINDSIKRNNYYRLNLFSVMEITGTFLRLIKQNQLLSNQKYFCHIINISSLAAIKPMTGLLDYCIGKASREAYFKQLSNDLSDQNSNIKYRILNYSPGPLQTSMFRLLQTDSLLKKQFENIIPLKPEDSAEKLLNILNDDKFINASHIDYYDYN